MTTGSVVLVDDHELVAEALSVQLTCRDLATKVIRPAPPAALLGAIRAVHPVVALLDLDLGEFGDATPLVGPLTAAGIRVVILTGETDPVVLGAVLARGAIGVQPKSAGFDGLVSAVTTALDGRPVHPDRSATYLRKLHDYRAARAAALAPFTALTTREQQTLRLLADGISVRHIAETWVVSQTTVRSHVQAVLRKLGVGTQLQAVAAARASGWLDEQPGEAG